MSGVAQLALANELNQLSTSRLIADSAFRLVFANTHAESHLQTGTLFSVTSDYRLVFRHPDHKRQVQRAFGIQEKGFKENILPSNNFRGSNLQSHGSANAPVVLTSEFTQILIRKVETGRGAYYSISIFDERSPKKPDADILKASFGLTNAETRLALLLAAGSTIADATEKLCVSRHTVRAHLRALFEKVGVSRQADLVRKIISGPAMS